jgi:alpha-glucosidase (family GH31 glycosyl hydrolase)
VRAGAILPFGPVKQFTGETSEQPVYPGAEAWGTIYEDDGNSFNYRRGESMKIGARWDNEQRHLSVHLQKSSHMLPPLKRKMEVRVVPEKGIRTFEFEGRPIKASL